jgi:hypothetical protein
MNRSILLATSLFFSAISSNVWSFCDIIEDPPISETNCNQLRLATPTPGFTAVAPNPEGYGLLNTGGMSAAVATSMTANEGLAAKVLPTTSSLSTTGLKATVVENQWIEVRINKLSGQQQLSIQSYQLNAQNQAVLMGSAQSAWLASTAVTSFDMAYEFNQGQVIVKLLAPESKVSLTQLQVSNFGSKLPAMQIRRGAQPADSGFAAADFARLTYWGN